MNKDSMDYINSGNKVNVAAIIGVGILSVFMVILMMTLNVQDTVTDTQRLDRFDRLMGYDSIIYGAKISFNSSISVAEFRRIYYGVRQYPEVKVITESVIGYVCDGTNEGMIEGLME